VLDVLRSVACGELTPEEAAAVLRAEGVLRLGDVAALDIERRLRTGIPEVVLAEHKRAGDVAEIVGALLERTGAACVSRMRKRHVRAVERVAAESGARLIAYRRRSCRVVGGTHTPPARGGLVGLISAGTSDSEALAEAHMVCEAVGCETARISDVGVAGLHRLLRPLSLLLRRDVDAIVVAAGMDGALPSVVAGLSPVPVIGLPVSTGYGRGGRGEAALLSMLQGCVPSLCTVNIDNGVGAGAVAALIARRRFEASTSSDAAATGARVEETSARR
jgi:NCAIR mutase (PurE)-related protein